MKVLNASVKTLSLDPFVPPPPQGSRCSDPCSEGLWGRHCNQTCFKHCPNSDTCLRETGACVCRPGYWGVTCQNSECCCHSSTGFPVCLGSLHVSLTPRMQSWHVWRPVQYVVPILWPVVPLPPCNRRV